jgi:hypothetical protein
MSKYKASRPLKKVVPDSVISEAIISLHQAEKDTNQNNTGASTKPESYKLEANEKNLDSLAALLTGEETCAAVCHDGNNLLIASNESGPKYAKQYLPLLKKYIDSPFKKNYQLLEQEANEQIKNIIKDLNVSGKLDQGLKKAKAHKDTNYEWLAKSIILRDLESIKRVGEIIIQDSSSHQQTRELAIEVLRPLIDTRIIANTLETSQGLDSKVILAIKNDHIKYLTSSSYKHAEMKIFDELLDNNKVGLYYIGITKLTCWPCDASLILFNKAGYELRIIFGGTHGGTYPSWEAPNWIISDVKIKQQFVDYVKKEAGKYFKEKEAHPYFDEFIPTEPILAQYNDQEEVLANFKHLENLISEHQKKCYDIQQEIKMRSEEKQAKMTLRNSSDIQDRSPTNDPTSKKQKIEHQLKSVTENIHQRQLSLAQANLTKSIFDQILNKQYASDTKKWEAMRDFLNEDKIFGKKVVSEIRDDKKPKNAIDKITSATQKYYTHLDTQCNQDTVKQLTDKIAELNREQIELNAIVNQQRDNTGDFKLEIGNLEQQVSERQLQLKRVKQDINPTMRKYLILKNILKKCLSYSDEENKNNLDVTCNDQDEDNETELDQVAHIVSFNNPYQIANDIHVLDNGANKATEDSYQYQCSDIRYIGKQLFGSMTGNIHWLGDIGEGHEDLEASNLLPSNIEKPVVGVYNIENFLKIQGLS